MGYSPLAFPHRVQAWLDAGWLKPGHVLIDFGAQEFYSSVAEVHREIGAFLSEHGLSGDRVRGILGNGLPQVRTIYEALRIKYYSIDIDGAHGSAFFDLNSEAPPAHWYDTFDFVNNEGTIEHLANPLNGFQVAQELAKVGGVIRHSFPLIGWREHGFFYATTKFYAHLVGDNGYELLKAQALLIESEPFDDVFFRQVINLKGEPVAPPAVTNIWGELVYRKVRDQPFVIPVDHLVGPNATTARQRLIKNYRRFARGRVRRSPAFWRIGPAIEPADNHYLGCWIFAVLGRLAGTHGRKTDGRR